jgi:hypothetical protein
MTERADRPRGQQDTRHEHTRHYSFEATAVRLGIPPELWEQPAVRQLIAGVNQVDNLQVDLLSASSSSSDQEANGTPSLAERYQAAGQLASIISAVLTDGFNNAPPIATTPERRGELQQQANYVFNRYGLAVMDTTQQDQENVAATSTKDKYKGVPLMAEWVARHREQEREQERLREARRKANLSHDETSQR